MWLLIDDQRDLNCDVIVRTPEAARKLLGVCLKSFDCVCFDHDLGTCETGYDILKWALKYQLLPNHVQLVTSNPVGRQNMSNLLKDYRYTTVNEIDFYGGDNHGL
jgi:hypothetical protein